MNELNEAELYALRRIKRGHHAYDWSFFETACLIANGFVHVNEAEFELSLTTKGKEAVAGFMPYSFL